VLDFCVHVCQCAGNTWFPASHCRPLHVGIVNTYSLLFVLAEVEMDQAEVVVSCS